MATTSECFAAMGSMVFAFQELEAEWVTFLLNISDIENEEQFLIVTSKLDFKSLLDVVGATARHKNIPVPLMERLNTELNVSTRYSEARNKYVHSHYEMVSFHMSGHVEYSRKTHRVSRKTGVKRDFENYDHRVLL